MANPFLYTDENVDETASFNPFFNSEVDENLSENPFLSDSNPFAYINENQSNENDDKLIDIQKQYSINLNTIHNDNIDIMGDKENQILNTVDLSDRNFAIKAEKSNPPSNMQDLISTLSTQLDMTSNKLLGQIPATRTPSPVSMRDLHSPSPTPDAVFEDLLGDSNENLMESENIVGTQLTKTNEDILNLYNPPRERKQMDFLCDDNISFENEKPDFSEDQAISNDLLHIDKQKTIENIDSENVNFIEELNLSSKGVTLDKSISQSKIIENDEVSSVDSALNPFSSENATYINDNKIDISVTETAETLITNNSEKSPLEIQEHEKNYPIDTCLIEEPDKFDLFTVKFEESKSKRNSLTINENEFVISTGSSDAWGAENNTISGILGFDADDNFSAMEISFDMVSQNMNRR
uniref:CSON014886 protein n=1 Tax=Culicoides sonorensis TaxID=179676 RepID=A0A336MBV0_CULSO